MSDLTSKEMTTQDGLRILGGFAMWSSPQEPQAELRAAARAVLHDRLALIRMLEEMRVKAATDAMERASEPPNDDVLRRIDRAYYDGARQASAMAHQSLAAMDEWIAGGCGGRGPVTKEGSDQ